MHKNLSPIAIIGFIFGVVTPFVGIFLGLQVSPLLGTVFAIPFVAASWLIGEPIGNLSALIKVVALLASGFVWSFIFVWTATALQRTSKHP